MWKANNAKTTCESNLKISYTERLSDYIKRTHHSNCIIVDKTQQPSVRHLFPTFIALSHSSWPSRDGVFLKRILTTPVMRIIIVVTNRIQGEVTLSVLYLGVDENKNTNPWFWRSEMDWLDERSSTGVRRGPTGPDSGSETGLRELGMLPGEIGEVSAAASLEMGQVSMGHGVASHQAFF